MSDTEARVARILPDDTVCACLDETGERLVRVFERCERCGAFMAASGSVTELDVERLMRAMYQAGIVVPRGTSRPAWRRQVEAVAVAYARLSGAVTEREPDRLREAVERLIAAKPRPVAFSEEWGAAWDDLRAALSEQP